MKDEEKIYGEDGKMPLKNDLKDQEKEGADLPSPEKSGEEEEKRRPAAAEKEELALELERLFAENQSLSAQLTALRRVWPFWRKWPAEGTRSYIKRR